MKSFAAAALLALSACALPTTGVAPQPQNYPHASTGEELVIPVGRANVSTFLREVAADGSIGAGGMLNASPSYGPAPRTTVATTAFTAAYDDAAAKAQAIARHIGTHLRGPASIVEVSRLAAGVPQMGGGPPMKRAMAVSADPGGGSALYVTFASDRGPIAVFGSAPGDGRDPSAYRDLRDANGVRIDIMVNDRSLAAAAKRLRDMDAAVRALAQKFGVGASEIGVESTSVSAN